VQVLVTLDFVDLANPILLSAAFKRDRRGVLVGPSMANVFVTAGEAQVIAEAWNRIADEIVERERGAA
jgi:hypothetical protein